MQDTFASLALATEPPSNDLLKRKPYTRFESLITPVMWKNIIMQALLQITILGTILFFGPTLFGVPSSVRLNHHEWNNDTGRHYSIFFNVFVMMQLFNEINSRKLKND
jgi:Ca2+ transporting ATPase